jgi:hypothetical protein
MTLLPPNLRYERKFLSQQLSLAQVLDLVRRHPAMFREVYPPRAVNNIYLDSPGLRDYFDHVNGAASRAKTRIRWYGACDEHIEKPTLERKIKRGAVSGKISHPLPALCIEEDVPGGVIDAILGCAGMPQMLCATSSCLQPSLVNRYQRRYYSSADGRFRLTVDWDLGFVGFRGFAAGKTPLPPRERSVIIELKFDPRHGEHAAAVTNVLPFRLASCSKYVLGINSMASL